MTERIAGPHDADAEAIVRGLGLEPAGCGYMGRPLWEGTGGSAIPFMITPDQRGELHSINVDQMYHFVAGAPLEVFVVAGSELTRHVLAGFGAPEGTPQLLIPAGVVHGSRTLGAYTLACTTSWNLGEPIELTSPTADQTALVAPYGIPPRPT